MQYTYNQRNLFNYHEKYIYTKYEGPRLFDAYFANRGDILKKCKVDKMGLVGPCLAIKTAYKLIKENMDGDERFKLLQKKLLQQYSIKNNLNIDSIRVNSVLRGLDINKKIQTSTLLNLLIESVYLGGFAEINNNWINRLIQRYEVTKKLYQEYLPGFRKGNGDSSKIKIYWLFAVLLLMLHQKTENLKYLSTMLKVNDLITSLPKKELNQQIPELGLDLLLTGELIIVERLIKSKGIERKHD